MRAYTWVIAFVVTLALLAPGEAHDGVEVTATPPVPDAAAMELEPHPSLIQVVGAASLALALTLAGFWELCRRRAAMSQVG